MEFSQSLLSQELLDNLYGAAVRPENGSVFTRQVAEMLHAATASVIVYDPRYHQGEVWMDSGYTEQMRRAVRDWSQYSPWLAAMEEGRPFGCYIGALQDVMPMSELRKSEFYNHALRPNDIEWAAAAVVFGPNGTVPGLMVVRPASEPAFGSAEKETLRQLLPHLRRAFDLFRTVASINAKSTARRYAMDLLGAPGLMLDRQGNVVSCNYRADLLIASGDKLRIENDRLKAILASEQDALDACVKAACNFADGRRNDLGANAVVVHSEHGAPLYISMMPYCSRWALIPDVPAALVFLTAPEENAPGEHRLWRALFGLTPAECRVADMMKQAMDVAEISEAIRIKPDTVRYYQKCVYRKTGVRGQRELLGLLSRLPSERAILPRGGDGPGFPGEM